MASQDQTVNISLKVSAQKRAELAQLQDRLSAYIGSKQSLTQTLEIAITKANLMLDIELEQQKQTIENLKHPKQEPDIKPAQIVTPAENPQEITDDIPDTISSEIQFYDDPVETFNRAVEPKDMTFSSKEHIVAIFLQEHLKQSTWPGMPYELLYEAYTQWLPQSKYNQEPPFQYGNFIEAVNAALVDPVNISLMNNWMVSDDDLDMRELTKKPLKLIQQYHLDRWAKGPLNAHYDGIVRR